jgi:hypothetical protein
VNTLVIVTVRLVITSRSAVDMTERMTISMNEQEYIKLAQKRAGEKVVDDFWQEVAITSTWISKDGTRTYFSELELGHLKNIINGLMTFENKNCKVVLNKLINELIIRVKRKIPKYAYEAVEELTELAINGGANKTSCENLKELILTEFNKINDK